MTELSGEFNHKNEQLDLTKWHDEWKKEVHKLESSLVEFYMPGESNGLMLNFLSEAIKLGAVTLNNIDEKRTPSDLQGKQPFEIDMGKGEKKLNNWLEGWKSQAKEQGMNWYAPGIANGLMNVFFQEATYLGAMDIHEPLLEKKT